LTIKEWNVNNIIVDHEQLGLTGSPTKVKKVDNIIFQAVETKSFIDLDEDIDDLMKELVESHIVG
jgi:electron transfer flavoprotein beta subunit